jgi:thiol-disulfide isomerase/thioredoxin
MRYKLTLGLLILLITTQCSNTKPTDEQEQENNFADGIKLSGLTGKSIELSTYKGKTVILNIWATWCKPCIEEFPSMEVLQDSLDSNEFVLLLASNEELTRINKFVDRNNFDLNFISIQSPLESLGTYALPTTFIIDGDGNLISTETGSKDWGTAESIQEIKELSK